MASIIPKLINQAEKQAFRNQLEKDILQFLKSNKITKIENGRSGLNEFGMSFKQKQGLSDAGKSGANKKKLKLSNGNSEIWRHKFNKTGEKR
tara:strand:- start:245 stop:520 length:276 start_codon:yes stop_codon:yes gene_type:complete